MTNTSTTTIPKADANPRDAILNQLLAGPTYPEVASILLRDGLKKLYPTLNLDPHNTVVGEPSWDIVDGEIVPRPTRYETLAEMLAGLVNEKRSDAVDRRVALPDPATTDVPECAFASAHRPDRAPGQ
ncbi:hypothetical protein QZH47_22040 [Pseudomonas corrugata]